MFPKTMSQLHFLLAGCLTQYGVTVHTSDMHQAMSSAGGFAILHGASRSSREVLLTQHDSSTFQAGAQDTWTSPDMQDLGPLQKLTIGLKEQVPASSAFACWRCPFYVQHHNLVYNVEKREACFDRRTMIGRVC